MRLESECVAAAWSYMFCSSVVVAEQVMPLALTSVSPPSHDCVVANDSCGGVAPATNLMQQLLKIVLAAASYIVGDRVAPCNLIKSTEIVITPFGHAVVAALSYSQFGGESPWVLPSAVGECALAPCEEGIQRRGANVESSLRGVEQRPVSKLST